MSIIERIDMFTISLPHNCLYCKFGGKKFKVLDCCGLFDSYWKSGEDE